MTDVEKEVREQMLPRIEPEVWAQMGRDQGEVEDFIREDVLASLGDNVDEYAS